jgi:hypothetical protein
LFLTAHFDTQFATNNFGNFLKNLTNFLLCFTAGGVGATAEQDRLKQHLSAKVNTEQ